MRFFFSQGYTAETTLNEFYFRLANRYEFIWGGLDGMTSKKPHFSEMKPRIQSQLIKAKESEILS